MHLFICTEGTPFFELAEYRRLAVKRRFRPIFGVATIVDSRTRYETIPPLVRAAWRCLQNARSVFLLEVDYE